MTDIDDDNDLTTSPVDMFELYVEDFFDQEVHDPKTHISIPRDLAREMLKCVKKGQKGRGQRPRSELQKMYQDLIIDEARQRKADLRAANPGISAVDAAWQAADEAAERLERLHGEYGIKLAAETIKRRMD